MSVGRSTSGSGLPSGTCDTHSRRTLPRRTLSGSYANRYMLHVGVRWEGHALALRPCMKSWGPHRHSAPRASCAFRGVLAYEGGLLMGPCLPMVRNPFCVVAEGLKEEGLPLPMDKVILIFVCPPCPRFMARASVSACSMKNPNPCR